MAPQLARTLSRFSRVALAAAMPLTIALPALAGLPAAIDRVPNDAIVVFSIRSISELKADMDALGDKLPPLKDALADSPLGMVLAMPGLNAEGSVAACILGETLDPSAGEPPMVVIVPVTDAKQFMEGLGLTAEGDLYTGEIDGNPAAFKDIGGGFVAMSPTAELLGTFDGKAGKGAAHTKRLGKSGASLADSADLLVYADLAKLKGVIDEGMGQMKQQMEMIAAMAGPSGEQMQQSMAMMESVANTLTSEGDLAIMGASITGAGVSFDAGAQFKDGTATFKSLQHEGGATGILSRVPSMPYFLAFGADTSGEFIRNLVVEAQKMQGEAGSFFPAEDVMGKLDGMAFVMGTSPAIMAGGLFANSIVFQQTKEAPALIATMKDAMEKMNGTSSNGMKFATSYKRAEATVAGTPVDSWSMRMSVDPNDPNAMAAQQMSQAMMMIWGPGMGPSGYLAAGKNGIIQTLSKNTMLVEKALQVADAGGGLGTDAGLKATAANLPEDRSAEAYLGVGEILKTASGFMAMMGGGAGFTVPENLPPVGMSISTVGGAAGTRVFVPMEILTAIADIQAQMEGGGEEMDQGDAEGGDKPRF
jgi:hypothetical protein